MAELSVTPDASGRHLLIYGYFAFHQMAEINLTTGHLISTTTTQPPCWTAHRRAPPGEHKPGVSRLGRRVAAARYPGAVARR
jgi:hypothetical protein